jgi:ABC-2 type transport system permease protein
MTHLLTPFYQNILNVFIFIVPLITMKSFAEEKKLGTYDLLISYPLRSWEILLGKLMGSFVIVSFLLALTFIYSAVIFWKADPYLPQVLSTYLGYWLFLVFYVSAGVLASLLTENQIVAAIITYATILMASLLQFLAYILPSPWDLFFSHFLLVAHLETFRQGIILVGDIVAYLGITLILFFTAEFLLRRHYSR